MEIVAWASVGSIFGGITGYFVGERLRRLTIVRRLTAKKGEEMDLLVARYGGATLAIAALTPLPYSLACWACGALSMPLGKFTLIHCCESPGRALPVAHPARVYQRPIVTLLIEQLIQEGLCLLLI